MEDQRPFLPGLVEHRRLDSDGISLRFPFPDPCILRFLYIASWPQRDALEDPSACANNDLVGLHRL